jgi:tetratricopeptide (TPR) repeat protein
LDEAEDWYRKALAISEELGDKPSMVPTYHQLGRVAQLRGQLDEAEEWSRKALAITSNIPSMRMRMKERTMTDDPVATAARAAAGHLAAQYGTGLEAEVESALYARGSERRPEQYFDPVSLGSLIVSIASLAWTAYTDLKKRTAKPTADVVSRTVRVTLRERERAATPDHIVDVVVTEAIRATANEESTEN